MTIPIESYLYFTSVFGVTRALSMWSHSAICTNCTAPDFLDNDVLTWKALGSRTSEAGATTGTTLFLYIQADKTHYHAYISGKHIYAIALLRTRISLIYGFLANISSPVMSVKWWWENESMFLAVECSWSLDLESGVCSLHYLSLSSLLLPAWSYNIDHGWLFQSSV